MRQIIALISLLIFVSFSCQNENEEQLASDIYYTWEIVDFMSIESIYYGKPENSKILITFNKDGKYSLQLDVNSCGGSFKISNENKLEISGPGCTKMCCDSDFSNKIAIMLSQVETYTLEGNTLKLNVTAWGWINLELD